MALSKSEIVQNAQQADRDPEALNRVLRNLTELHTLPNATSDANAAAAGVEVGGLYRNGSILRVRVS